MLALALDVGRRTKEQEEREEWGETRSSPRLETNYRFFVFGGRPISATLWPHRNGHSPGTRHAFRVSHLAREGEGRRAKCRGSREG
jgi:hypothetical protein